MKKNIKKRVDDNNKNYTGIIFLLFILFVLVVGSVYLYLNKDVLINNYREKKKQVEQEKTIKKNNNNYSNIDISSPNIINLFNLVHNNDVGGDQVIYSNKKLSVDEMTAYYKFSLASNIYSDKAVKNPHAETNQITAYLEESVVKEAYELLFGLNTYKAIEVIPYSCTEMNYDTVHRRYVTTNQVCGGESSFNAHEKIISVKKDSKELLITSAVVFSSSETGSLCKDFGCTSLIDNYSSTITDSKYFLEYIDKNYNKLEQYTYKFKLNDDGFYYYQGFERTKE